MKNLPAALVLEKNKLASTGAWLVLLDITLPDTTVLRLVRNTENVVYNGEVYTAFPFDIDQTKLNSSGEIPTVALRVGNTTRTIQAYVEQFSGGVGSSVKVTVINSAHLSENYSELEMTFDVLGTTCDSQWVTFTLGAPNPLRRRFPMYRASATSCSWTYKGRECGYVGALPTCKRTLDDCRAHSNSLHFGGRPGLVGSVRLT